MTSVKQKKVMILGASGCLGHKLLQVAASRPDFEVVGTVRSSSEEVLEQFVRRAGIVGSCWILCDDEDEIFNAIYSEKPQYIINAIGYIKHRGEDAIQAIETNALLPHKLAECAGTGCKIVLISTDCIFNGFDGFYNWEAARSGDESGELPYYTSFSTPNASDIYGMSKALGEVRENEHVTTIRTSIVGPELAHKTGLLEWYFSQRNEPRIGGFVNHYFSGVSTLQLSRVICDVIENLSKGVAYRDIEQYASVPISKYELLLLTKKAFGGSVDITPMRVKPCNRVLWNTFAGESPNWSTMIEEMAADWKDNYQ